MCFLPTLIRTSASLTRIVIDVFLVQLKLPLIFATEQDAKVHSMIEQREDEFISHFIYPSFSDLWNGFCVLFSKSQWKRKKKKPTRETHLRELQQELKQEGVQDSCLVLQIANKSTRNTGHGNQDVVRPRYHRLLVQQTLTRFETLPFTTVHTVQCCSL